MMCDEGGGGVDLPEHLPPLLGAHARVFILSTAGRGEVL